MGVKSQMELNGNRKKALVVVEPRREIGFGSLSKMNKFRNILEAHLWVLPIIKKISKSNKVSIFSGVPFAENFLRKRKITVIEGKIPEVSLEHALKETINLCRGWHLYGELPELLQIRDVNVGETIQFKLMGQIFNLLREIELANALIERERPDIVYIESNLFQSGQAFDATASAKGVKRYFLEPRFYRNLKEQVGLYLEYKSYKRLFVNSVNLYSINETWSDRSKYVILLDVIYANYFNAVFPAIMEVIKQNACECYIRGRNSVLSKRLNNMKRVDIKSQNATEYKENVKKLRAYYHSELKKDTKFQNIFEYKGINFWDVIKGYIGLLFDKQFPDIIFSILYFDKVIDNIQPDILVVGDDRAATVKGHVLLAKKKGVPTLEIQHGLCVDTMPLDTPVSDRIALGGDYSKKVFMKFGAKKEQLVVTGWPKFDTHVKSKESLTGKHKDGTDILFATGSGDIKITLDTIEAIGSFIEDSTHFRLIIKPHPTENRKIYNQIAKNYKNVVLHKSSEDISSLIASTDILVNFFSTVAIEAAFLDKPIICINTTNSESMYASSGIAIEVKKLEELIPAIKDALYNEEVRKKLAEARKRFVYEHAYKQDGKASERVANLIVQMIEESKKAKVPKAF